MGHINTSPNKAPKAPFEQKVLKMCTKVDGIAPAWDIVMALSSMQTGRAILKCTNKSMVNREPLGLTWGSGEG